MLAVILTVFSFFSFQDDPVGKYLPVDTVRIKANQKNLSSTTTALERLSRSTVLS